MAAPLPAFVVATWPDLDSLSVRLVVSTAIQIGYMAAPSGHLLLNTVEAPAGTPVSGSSLVR